MGGGLTQGLFHKIISLNNLLFAWKEFRRGKRRKLEVQKFEFNLERNLFTLNGDLLAGVWQPGPYHQFYVCDPKLRQIHKASVRDRVLHQAVFRILYRIFNPTFIFDSYSCRNKKGVHRSVNRLEDFCRKVTMNWRQPAYALKCDIRKFFDSVDQIILLELIKQKVQEPETLALLGQIVDSFRTTSGKGLPLGNVTSQLFANIYLNELDQFVKHQLKAKYYLRYCDDFIIISPDKNCLINLVTLLDGFLQQTLHLSLHPNKISLRKISQGVDYLGYVTLPHYRVFRTKTKNRILDRAARGQITDVAWPSYLGLLSHCQGGKVFRSLLESRFSSTIKSNENANNSS